ncbi:MAG: hypothetical protein H6730_30545 [Deltaproteobacteria bacterium]|nr:hypothetical protein [Deltaproteobacteria bacterium]
MEAGGVEAIHERGVAAELGATLREAGQVGDEALAEGREGATRARCSGVSSSSVPEVGSASSQAFSTRRMPPTDRSASAPPSTAAPNTIDTQPAPSGGRSPIASAASVASAGVSPTAPRKWAVASRRFASGGPPE